MGYAVRIKICGVTNEADARLAGLLGADAVGLNFYEQSPRYVDAERARYILQALPPFVDAVGVYVNRPLRQIVTEVQMLGRIWTVQCHGPSPELSDCFPLRRIVAFPVKDAADIKTATRFLDTCRVMGALPSAVLVDASVPGKHGGTGQRAPWPLLAAFRPPLPLILAGGLTPENVAEAIHVVRPYAVDVASGVEQSPGQKDPEKMRRFIANVREAAARL
jgi:phosphoribosylanthranilate isomerase